MSNRFDNKKLLFILAGLLLVLLFTLIIKIPKQKSTIKDKLVDIDTAEVYRIAVIPRVSTGAPFEFVKGNGKWNARQGNIVAKPEKNAVDNVFSAILGIKPQSLAAVDKSKWNEYDLTDSLATRIKFLNKKDKVLADIMIGKFTFKQVNNPYMSGGNNVEGTTFVRLSDDMKIYAVEGFLALSFSGRFSDWRDKSFIRCKKEDILKIAFTIPGDSSYVLMKKDSGWFIGEQQADSTAVSDYLNGISYMNGEEFEDGYKSAAYPDYTVSVEGNKLLNVIVKCYKAGGEDKYILNSSLNPEVYYSSTRNKIFEQLFKPESYFFQQRKTK
jgi:hypothetical protein